MSWIERQITFKIFIFRVMVIFVLKSANFRWIFAITLKTKIGKLFFYSIQHIAHLSWKFDHIWEGGGGGACVSLIGNSPFFSAHELSKTYANKKSSKSEQTIFFAPFLMIFLLHTFQIIKLRKKILKSLSNSNFSNFFYHLLWMKSEQN